MRLKLVLEASGEAPRDVVVSCDTTVTVGELAAVLSGAKLRQFAGGVAVAGSGRRHGPRVVNPLFALAMNSRSMSTAAARRPSFN